MGTAGEQLEEWVGRRGLVLYLKAAGVEGTWKLAMTA